MKLRLLMALVLVIGLSAGSAMAQGPSDSFGALDSIALVPVGDPASGHFQVDLYVYSDEALSGGTMGFHWNNSKVQMDSAKAGAALTGGFDQTFFYQAGSITTTNANQNFLFGALAFFTSGLQPQTSRRLWASYYFHTTGWTGTDNVVFDTLTFDLGSQYLLTEFSSNAEIIPYWLGKITIGAPANNPPILAPIGSKVVNEGALLAFTVTASDPDGGTPTLSTSALPTGATFNPSTGAFSWTPTFSQAGPYSVTFRASDGLAVDTEIVAITVNNVNQAPVLAPIGSKVVNEGALLSFVVTASDPDGGAPTLSATNLPEGATFTPATGAFSWTPTFAQSGSYPVTFRATDPSMATDEEVVTITVNNVNQAPVLASIGPKVTTVLVPLQFTVNATDADEQALTLSTSALPTGATFTDNGDGSGTFDWTPAADQAGPHEVTFTVSDGTLTDQEVVTITVNAGENQAPVLAAIGGKTIDEGALLQFVVSASDPDGGFPALTAEDLPTGATFVDSLNGKGLFSWTPGFNQANVYNVRFIASDGDKADSELVEIVVNNVNQAPVLASIGPKSTPVLVQLLFNVNATDADGQALTLTTSALPTGATFTDNGDGSGTFDWTPSADQAGPHEVTFTVSDGTLTDQEIVTITVTEGANQAPVLDPIGSKMIDEGALLSFVVTASDPDGSTPTLSATNLPTGASFTPATGAFSWTPTFAQAGSYDVTFTASDGSLTDDEIVTITVNNVNQAPELFSNAANTTIDECGSVSFWFAAFDADGQALTFSAVGLVANMVFEAIDTSASFTFTPDTNQAGTYPVTVWVTDGEDSASIAFTITVDECVTPPTCVDLLLSDTAIFFYDTVSYIEGPYGFDNVGVTSSGPGEGCFVASDTTDWLSVLPATKTCTPANLTISYDATGLPEGNYYGIVMVAGDTTVCEPNDYFVLVHLQLVDTTTPPSGGTLYVGTAPAAPGAQVVVPMNFENSCDLFSAQVTLGWNDTYLTLDSVTFAGSRVAGFPVKTVDIYTGAAVIAVDYGGSVPMVAPGYGNFANLFVTVSASAPAGFHEISIVTPTEDTYFGINCGELDQFIPPVPEDGGVVVDTATQFTCGYVVDTAGNPIAGATVQMWSQFASVGPEAATTSAADGYFEFRTFFTGQFDLWGFKEGYYPGLIENVNWGTTGIMIVLTPYEPVEPTLYWVDFYCDANTYFGADLPAGSVIDAYDPDGIRCGNWFVTEEGKYGFMPVYGEEPWNEGDQGAEPGDVIRFFINGVEAEAAGNTVWTNAPTMPQMVCLNLDVCSQTCRLTAGWNLVSWSIDTESDQIESALASIASHLELVLGFEQGGLTYDPNLPQFSTLWYVDHYSGYWVKVDADVDMRIEGACANAATPITVTPGWNLVSYLPGYAMATPDALSSIHSSLMVALGFDGTAQIYVPGEDPFNTLDQMGPCLGYWLKVTAGGELIYPVSGPVVVAQQPQQLGNAAFKAAAGITATTQWMNLYAQKLTVDGKAVPAGAMVEAFTRDGVKIGSSAVRGDGLFGFMPVYADDPNTGEIDGVRTGEPFTLTVNGVPVTETFVFSGHGSQLELGNLTAKAGEEPVIPMSYSLSQNYPNPFNPTTTIEFSLPKSTRARVEVFNILGELVATPFDGTASSGTTTVTWDGRSSTGAPVASGVYFYRLSADNYTETKKMMLMK